MRKRRVYDGRHPLVIAALVATLLVLGAALLWDVGRQIGKDEALAEAIPSITADRVAALSELDLIAQQEMARWTMLSILTTFLGTTVGAVGLLFLSRTLSAATEANAINSEVGRQQTRAYLAVTRATHQRVFQRYKDRQMAIDHLWLSLANSGQTPAVNISYFCSAELTKDDELTSYSSEDHVKDHKFINNLPANSDATIKATSFGITKYFDLMDCALTTVDGNTWLMNYPAVRISGQLYYEDVFGETFRSDFCFVYRGDPRKEYGQEPKELELLQTSVPMFRPVARRPAVEP